jgi:hypothetical protein
MNGWSTPLKSVLIGTDKDALQQIISSLEAELGRLNRRIGALEDASGKPNVSKEQKGY